MDSKKPSSAEKMFRHLVVKIWKTFIRRDISTSVDQKEALRKSLLSKATDAPTRKKLLCGRSKEMFQKSLQEEGIDAHSFVRICVDGWNVYPECQTVSRVPDGTVLIDSLFNMNYGLRMLNPKGDVKPAVYIPFPSNERQGSQY